jgi:Uma2 family endonuclease
VTRVATTSLLSIDEYLHTSYRPDVEFIDGELKERPVVMYVHGEIQSAISMWFGNHKKEWSVVVAVEARTRVSPTRVRLPDVIVDHLVNGPRRRREGTANDPPLIVIEVLSERDTYAETQRLARDYQQMGIQNIWLIEPETRTGRFCKENAWIETRRFEAAGTPIYLDLDWLFSQLDDEQQ